VPHACMSSGWLPAPMGPAFLVRSQEMPRPRWARSRSGAHRTGRPSQTRKRGGIQGEGWAVERTVDQNVQQSCPQRDQFTPSAAFLVWTLVEASTDRLVVEELGMRREHHPLVARPQPQTEVDIVEVHWEERFIWWAQSQLLNLH
jgi:hypothetical protein